jgi:hypothetical protein
MFFKKLKPFLFLYFPSFLACFCLSPKPPKSPRPLAPAWSSLLRPSIGLALKSATAPTSPFLDCLCTATAQLQPCSPPPPAVANVRGPSVIPYLCRLRARLPCTSRARHVRASPRLGPHNKRSAPSLFKVPSPPRNPNPSPSHLPSSAPRRP